MKIFKEDLTLKKDTEFTESIKVEGNIKGCWNLKVAGDIDARNIDAENIDAGNIVAWDIDARNIDAENIDARNINARDIDAWDIDARNINARNIVYCEKRLKKIKTATTKCRVFIQNRSKLKIKTF